VTFQGAEILIQFFNSRKRKIFNFRALAPHQNGRQDAEQVGVKSRTLSLEEDSRVSEESTPQGYEATRAEDDGERNPNASNKPRRRT